MLALASASITSPSVAGWCVIVYVITISPVSLFTYTTGGLDRLVTETLSTSPDPYMNHTVNPSRVTSLLFRAEYCWLSSTYTNLIATNIVSPTNALSSAFTEILKRGFAPNDNVNSTVQGSENIFSLYTPLWRPVSCNSSVVFRVTLNEPFASVITSTSGEARDGTRLVMLPLVLLISPYPMNTITSPGLELITAPPVSFSYAAEAPVL